MSYDRPACFSDHINVSSVSHASGRTLTDEYGAAHKSFGEAVQPKGVRNVVIHEGNVHDPYSIAHPALFV